MFSQKCMLFVVASALTIVSLGTASADTILLSDDFNDNSLDTSKWSTYLPDPDSTVVEANQRLELTNRGTLTTVGQFDPCDYDGGITISGQVNFYNLGDYNGGNQDGWDNYAIYVRSSGTYEASGKALDAIAFRMSTTYAGADRSLGIYTYGSNLTVGSMVVDGALVMSADTWYDFTIVDGGTSGVLSFTMTEHGNPSNTASVTAMVTMDNSSTNYVGGFTGRNSVNGYSHIEYLDNFFDYSNS